MKDNLQNIADLIGALAEDIEEIKKMLAAKGTSDKDEALKRLAVKLEPVIRFFGGSTPENINDIFRSKETIEAYKKSLGDEMIVSLQIYTDANDKDMRKRGIPTTKDLLYKILEMLTFHVENDRRISEKEQQWHTHKSGLWQVVCPKKALSGIRKVWNKIPSGWYKNSYAWAGIFCTFVFFSLSAISWVQWHDYREENMRLRTVVDKHKVTTTILNGLYPELGVTVSAYEKLVETVGVDSALTVLRKQLKAVRKTSDKNN